MPVLFRIKILNGLQYLQAGLLVHFLPLLFIIKRPVNHAVSHGLEKIDHCQLHVLVAPLSHLDKAEDLSLIVLLIHRLHFHPSSAQAAGFSERPAPRSCRAHFPEAPQGRVYAPGWPGSCA